MTELSSEKKVCLELVFCINSPQTRYETNIKGDELVHLIQRFDSITENELSNIYKGRIRFHRRKAHFCIEAYKKIDEIINVVFDKTKGAKDKRDWLYENITGLGMKEASHFMRNIGMDNGELAILDVHILKSLGYPKNFISSRSEYLGLEDDFIKIAKSQNKSAGELDLEIWEKFRAKGAE